MCIRDRASTSCVAHWGKEPRMTAVTGTGCTRFLRHVTEYVSDFYANNAGFDFQGVTAYFDWSPLCSRLGTMCSQSLSFTLLHTNFRNYSIVTLYVNWDFVIPTWNFELPALVTDWLSKHVLNYDIIIITCITALVRERTCSLTVHLSSTCILQPSRHYCTLKASFATVTVTWRSASLHTYLKGYFVIYVNDFIETG